MKKHFCFPLVLFAILSLAAVKPPLAVQTANIEQDDGFSDGEDEYLVGDWDGDGKDNLAVRRDDIILMDYNFDDTHDFEQGYGFGDAEDEYLVGDWDGDGRDNLAVRRDSTILMDYNFDGDHDFEQSYGDVSTFDENYLVGDWDGDGRDNIAVRRDSLILMDYNFDGDPDFEQSYGQGNDEDEYLVGDWDGDGKDNLAFRRDGGVLMDYNFDGTHEFDQAYGGGDDEDEYLVGDWNGDGRDNLAVRRDDIVLMDYNFDGDHDFEQGYGQGNKNIVYLPGLWAPDDSLYDNFDNPAYDGTFNSTLWIPRGDCEEVAQNDGAMVFQSNCELVVRPTFVTFDQLALFEARVKVTSDHTGEAATQEIIFDTNDLPGGDWWAFCGIIADSEGVKSFFNVVNVGLDEFDIHRTLPAEYDRWYTIRLEVDLDTVTFSCTVDDQLLGSVVPKNASLLKEARFERILQAARADGAFATTYVDYVRVTNGQ